MRTARGTSNAGDMPQQAVSTTEARSGSRASSAIGTTEAPVAAPVERTRTLDETLPPYRVVLHNDDVNDMMHVVQSLLAAVPELSPERAIEVMLAAHNHGSAEVIVCFLERAELYRNRLESRGLTATIERA